MNLNRILFVVALIATGSIAMPLSAEDSAQKTAKKPSPGLVEVKGSQKGLIAIVNHQSRVPTTVLDEAAAVIAKQTLCNAQVTSEAKGEVLVEVVDDAQAPILTAYPEDYRAVVNVAKLTDGLKGKAVEKFLPLRAQREVLRGFCFACGGAGTSYPDNILAISKISDLDLIHDLFIPGDASYACVKRLLAVGVTPKRLVPYIRACREGYAPAPTNDIQKAIWDKVHALPTEPLTIKPETKPVKE